MAGINYQSALNTGAISTALSVESRRWLGPVVDAVKSPRPELTT